MGPGVSLTFDLWLQGQTRSQRASAQPRTNQLRIHRESLSLIIITAFVGGGKCATACVEEREQLAGEGSLLPPCGLGTELGSSVLAAGTHSHQAISPARGYILGCKHLGSTHSAFYSLALV